MIKNKSINPAEAESFFDARKDMSRRTFLRVAATSVGALALGNASMSLAAQKTRVAMRYPLHIPPTVSPKGFGLSAAPAKVDLGDGRYSAVLAYNKFFPGPTFRANSGDSASIKLTNGLEEETTVHWHGMIVPPNADGHPRDAVAPGKEYLYQFPISQRACLNWYHPHPHMLTGKQVALGLAGAFILNDAEETALGLPSGAYEVPLIIRDASLDRGGNLQYTPKSGGFLGDISLVNGTLNPQLDVDKALYRFRVLNGANARILGLALSSGAQFILIGNDGGLLESPVPISRIDISPGERLDIIVDFRSLSVGTRVVLRDLREGWDLLEFVVASNISVAGSIPTGTLSTIPKLTNPVTTRVFSFDGMSRINGKVYDVDRIDFSVPFGQTELWSFTTKGNAPHPVHVHGASFQVQSRTGGRGAVFPWERGWKDTVLLEDGETVDVLIRFDRYRGLYLIHCHKLEHEDMGMMSNFEVV